MKKLLTIFIIFLFVISYVQSYEEHESKNTISQGNKSFRMPDRIFEMGINAGAGVATNIFKPLEFFRKGEVVEIDLNGLNKGLDVGFDVNAMPLFFNVNVRDEWGFGLDIAKITAYGNIEISGNLLQFSQTDKDGDNFGFGASAFTEVGIPVFFHIKNVWDYRALKINFRPAGFIPVLYAVPNMTYTMTDINKKDQQGVYLGLDYEARIYAPVSLNSDSGIDISTLNVGSALGVDFSLGAEFPLFDWIDVGVDFVNIPLAASKLSDYMLMKGNISIDTSKMGLSHFFGGEDPPEGAMSFPDNYDPSYGFEERRFYRPFKMLFSADFRLFRLLDLFEFPSISILPVLGFSINPVYVNPGAVEAALRFRVDLANMLITTLGFAYEDRMWKNGIDLTFNFRALELDIGASMQSQDFVKSWQGTGVRVYLGTKFGW